jgi:hypothetical protein
VRPYLVELQLTLNLVEAAITTMAMAYFLGAALAVAFKKLSLTRIFHHLGLKRSRE